MDDVKLPATPPLPPFKRPGEGNVEASRRIAIDLVTHAGSVAMELTSNLAYGIRTGSKSTVLQSLDVAIRALQRCRDEIDWYWQ